ncbi:MAG: hypothetical protein ABIY47_13230 [Opitutaceae bacterium]
MDSAQHPVPEDKDESISLRDLLVPLARGLRQIVGLALLGLVIAAVGSFLAAMFRPITTSTRVVFSFPGFERGEYPDRSKFQSDDLRAPSIIGEALKRQKLDTSIAFQSKIRGGLGIEGVIPANIVKERDRIRLSGQTPPPYIPDEYVVTLSLPRSSLLNDAQRNSLLNEIVSVYREKFNDTYADVPEPFGNAFTTLRQADFPEYQLILDKEIESISSYLEQLLLQTGKERDETKRVERQRSFRSPTTNLSFKDLLEQTQLFAQIRLNETLGLIYQNGLSRDRSTALVKMDYYLRVLDHQERRASEEESLVRGLLTQSQERSQNYVLGIKSQAASPRSDGPILDQGLVDSLLANDAYNFLVRQTLQAGLRVKQIQSEKARLMQLRENMKSFLGREIVDQVQLFARVNKSLTDLETSYQQLITNIRNTHADFARQQYGDAIRLSAEIQTEGVLKSLAIAGFVGALLGAGLGAAFAFLGAVGRKQA